MEPRKTKGSLRECPSFLLASPCLILEDDDEEDLLLMEGGSEKVTERERERDGLL